MVALQRLNEGQAFVSPASGTDARKHFERRSA